MRADRGGENMNDDERRSIKRLKNDHLDALEAMIMGTNLKVEGKEIRGTDVPTEYVFIFAFVFIGTIGAFVGY